ncbi:MAG: ACT domain-containing protein [Phycisphaerae bacterium]|jgi:ACT domain-containing protein
MTHKTASEAKICIITVTGKDKVGIIARISNELAALAVNIIDVNQKIMSEELFVMTMAADFASSDASIAQVRDTLAKVAEEMDLRINCQDERIFAAMHRV